MLFCLASQAALTDVFFSQLFPPHFFNQSVVCYFSDPGLYISCVIDTLPASHTIKDVFSLGGKKAKHLNMLRAWKAFKRGWWKLAKNKASDSEWKNSALTFSDKSVSCSGDVWGRCCLCLSIVRVNYSCKQYGKILISWAGFLIASPPLRVMSYGKRHPVCIQIDEITKPLLCNFSDLFITSFWRRGEGGEGEGFWVI